LLFLGNRLALPPAKMSGFLKWRSVLCKQNSKEKFAF
jgi:hypothetical protein